MLISFRPTRTLTNDDIATLSRENPGVCFERDAGGKLIVSPTGTLGGRGELGLAVQADAWAQRDGSGFATPASAGFTLPDGSIFSPDTAWVSYKRWNALSEEERKGYARIAPNVAFELLSSGDTLRDARAKAETYLANGTRLVVLLDPHTKSVELHRRKQAAITHVALDAISLDPEMPGFTLDAAAVFKRMQ